MRNTGLAMIAVLSLAQLSMEAHAQAWPSKPIRAIVPYTPGSASDVLPRVIFEQLSTELGHAIVVENRAGAGGTLGTAAVAKAEPDGYTILVQSTALTIAPSVFHNLGYDTLRDLKAVAPLGISPNVLIVSPSRGIKSVSELASAAKAKPGSFTFASAGIGTNTHLSAERFRMSAGIEAVHIPFKGGPEAITEVIAGRIDFAFFPVGIVLSHVREGTLLALAVNSSSRSSLLPAVPTTGEAGVADSEYPIWWGLFVPAKTPSDVVDKLNRVTLKTLQAQNVREKLSKLGVDPFIMTASELNERVERELGMNATLVKMTGVKSN
jgi:tripartite-type tricarboxylate transporter receptor subunit TctC